MRTPLVIVYTLISLTGFASARLAAADGVPLVWSLKPPPTLALSETDAIPFTIIVGGKPVTRVTLAAITLTEQSRKFPFAPKGFALCRSIEDVSCNRQIDLEANSTPTLWIRPLDPRAAAGHFLGSVTISCAEKPEGDAFQLEIFASRSSAWLCGAAAIFLSVILAWLLSVWARARLNRDQLLLPAVVLRERVIQIGELLKRAPDAIAASAPRCTNEANNIANVLSDASLAATGYVPVGISSPFSGASSNVATYRQFLDGVDSRVTALSTAVKDGMLVAWDQLPAGATAITIQAVKTAIAAIDAQIVPGGPPPQLSALLGVISAQLSVLATTLTKNGLAARALQGAPTATKEYERLNIEIQTINGVVWAGMLVLTTAVGIYALILPNLGFGLLTDYFACVLWGFGVPVSLQQLTQLSAGTAATALGITIQK